MESADKQLDKQTTNDKPWMWKKGQSGNPKGRPKGKTMKEYSREYLASMNDEERAEFMEGLSKELIWKMAEGNPETKIEAKVDETHEFSEEDLDKATKIIEARLSKKTLGGSSGDQTPAI